MFNTCIHYYIVLGLTLCFAALLRGAPSAGAAELNGPNLRVDWCVQEQLHGKPLALTLCVCEGEGGSNNESGE